MTAGAARGDRLEKSAERLQSDEDNANDDDDGDSDVYGDETEVLFPEERVKTNFSSATRTNVFRPTKTPLLHHMGSDESEEEYGFDPAASTTERSRFQRISFGLHSTSTRDATTSPRNVVFRTRV